MEALLWKHALIARMKLNQWKGAEGLRPLQDSMLRRLFLHASQNVPYYRKMLAGASVRGLDALPSISPTPKSALKADARAFVSAAHSGKPLYPVTTAGSSGIPLTVYYDKQDMFYADALAYHQFGEAGRGPLNSLAHLHPNSPKAPKMKGLFYPTCGLPFDAEDADLLGRLKSLRPDCLLSISNRITLLAHSNRQGGAGVRIPRIFSYSELLTEEARSLISSSFGCDLRNFYGLNECFWIAWECERGSMHVHSDSVIVEVADDEGAPLPEGKSGNLLVTPLWRNSMPIIRYETGDVGSLSQGCPCGRGTPVLKTLEGRKNDFIATAGGRLLSPRVIFNALRDLDYVLQFQAVQEREGQLHLSIVPRGRPPSGWKQDLTKRLDALLPEPFEMTMETADSILREKSGKTKFVVSRARAARRVP